jgi:NADPH2:quinone reductase
MPGLIRTTHEDLMRLYDTGKIGPLISGTVSFEELPIALKQLGSRGTYGKVVTRPAD